MIIRKSEGRYFAERAIDQVLVYLSWLAAYFIRFEIDVMDGQQGLLSWYLQYGVLLIIISTYFFKNSKLYKNKGVASLAQDILNQVKSNTISVLCFVVFAFFLSQDRVSRFAILTYFIISTVVLTLNKILLRRYFMGKKTRVLLVGNGRAMKNYYLKIKKVNNINIIGSIDPIESFEGSCFKELTREGLEENKVDLVVIGY